MNLLNEYLNLDGIEDLRQYIKDIGRMKEFKKGEFFFEQGSISKYSGYIESGAFRYISYTSLGKEQIIGYSFENDFVSDYATFISGSACVVNAQTIKDSRVFMVSAKELTDYFDTCQDPNFRNKVTETFLSDIYNRLISLYCDTPQERYTKLVSRYPDILKQVHLKEIASFIKVTPETLSRIRKKMELFDET